MTLPIVSDTGKAIHVFASDVLPFAGCPRTAGGNRSKQIISALRNAGHTVTFSMALNTYLAKESGSRLLNQLTKDEIWACEHFFEPDKVLDRLQPNICIHCNINNLPTSLPERFEGLINIVDLYGPIHLETLFIEAPNYESAMADGSLLEKRSQDIVEKLRKADYLITVSERQKYFWSAYCTIAGFSLGELKILVCPAAFETPTLPRRTAPSLTVIHSGGFYPWQKPDRFLRAAAASLEHIEGAELHVFGAPHRGLPNEREASDLLASLQQYRCVRYHGYKPTEELLEVASRSWCALELMEQNIERELAITGRTVEFLSAGTPVIYNNYASLSRLIEKYEAGWTLSTADDSGLNAIFRKLVQEGPAYVEQLSRNARRLASTELTADCAMAPLVDLCAERLKKRRYRPTSIGTRESLRHESNGSARSSMPGDSQTRMWLDEPSESQVFGSRTIRVRGWAIGGDSNFFSITARIDDLPWLAIEHGKLRPDVEKAYPQFPGAKHSGFSGQLTIQNLPAGEHHVFVRVSKNATILSEIKRAIRIVESSQMARESLADNENDGLRLTLEEPGKQFRAFRGSIFRVGGWAIARSGIRTVEISVDSGELRQASYGTIREDIGSSYPGYSEALRSGFFASIGTGGLEAGCHVLHIRAVSRGGTITEVSAPFEVDSRSEYEVWMQLNSPTQDELLAMVDRCRQFVYAPKISVVTPVYRTPEDFLQRCVSSVKRQTYPNWELILVDDGSRDNRLTRTLQSFAAGDRRIRVFSLPENQGIAGASNAGLARCQGDYVGLLDHDDELSPNALYEVVQALNADPSLDVFYSDEDKIDETGKHRDAFFKPDWSPNLLLSINYVCHFLVARRSLLETIGGFRLGFDGSQDYDLILRLSEHTNKIRRIPKILYHWRVHPTSTASNLEAKPEASGAGRRAIEEHLHRRGIAAEVSEISLCRYRVRYDLSIRPEVQIIIPTGGSDTLRTALGSIFEKTSYSNYKVLVIDNSNDVVDQEGIKVIRSGAVEILDCRHLPFNFSRLCNLAAQRTKAPYLLFLNDDTKVITADWIEAMLEHAQREEVGAVGAQLLFPTGDLQHAGVVTGLMGVAGHPFRGLPSDMHYFGLSQIIRNCSAVTGACLLTRRDVFESVGGFDEANLPTRYQDVDLCLKMIEAGYRIVYTPFAQLYHFESYSVKDASNTPEIEYMRQRWAKFIEDDPFYNPSLTRRSEDYGLGYDQLFKPVDGGVAADSGKKPLPSEAESRPEDLTSVNARHHHKVEFHATPNPSSPVVRNLGQTTLFWNVIGVKRVQIRVGSPTGSLFASGGPSGKESTGPWVEPDTVFYLLDASKTDSPSPEDVLATVKVAVVLRLSSSDLKRRAQHA